MIIIINDHQDQLLSFLSVVSTLIASVDNSSANRVNLGASEFFWMLSCSHWYDFDDDDGNDDDDDDHDGKSDLPTHVAGNGIMLGPGSIKSNTVSRPIPQWMDGHDYHY